MKEITFRIELTYKKAHVYFSCFLFVFSPYRNEIPYYHIKQKGTTCSHLCAHTAAIASERNRVGTPANWEGGGDFFTAYKLEVISTLALRFSLIWCVCVWVFVYETCHDVNRARITFVIGGRVGGVCIESFHVSDVGWQVWCQFMQFE